LRRDEIVIAHEHEQLAAPLDLMSRVNQPVAYPLVDGVEGVLKVAQVNDVVAALALYDAENLVESSLAAVQV
jgi:hypothetical protein